ncbi:MAG: hypothetical protein L3J43_03715 [Sulfurovum sp.]|nr:hypothetical protein [Sulfurovum sp.]
MLDMFKNLFLKPKKVNVTEDKSTEPKPGRTFNKILTGKYFGLDDKNANKKLINELKDKKIQQINELGLTPKFARYIYAKGIDDYSTETPISVHVAFQKERYSRKRQMIHISEMSFIVKANEFEEFEKKLEVNILNDFTQLAPEHTFKGTERRKEQRAV